MKKGRLIIISGPSGSGKTTICNGLLKVISNLESSVSYTTRAPRRGEKEGRDYFFLSKEDFSKNIKDGIFLEYAKVFDNYYGTNKERITEKIENRIDVLLSIDVQGAAKIKKNFPDAVLIFLMPPSLKVLEERLRKRATDDDNEVAKRLAVAQDEMSEVGKYDYVVINDKVDTAVMDIKEIVEREK